MKEKLKFIICLFFCFFVLTGCFEIHNEVYTVSIEFGKGFESEIYNIKYSEKIPADARKAILGENVSHFVDENGKVYDFDDCIYMDLNLIAVWEITKFSVRFYDDDNNLLHSYVGLYGSEIIYPETLYKEPTEFCSYEFIEWVNKPTIIEGNTNIIAKFKKIWENVSVTILDVEGNVTSVNYYLYADYFSEEIKEPQFEKEPGKYYRFLGWYDKHTDEKIDFNKSITKNYILEPRYEVYLLEETTLENATISFLGDSILTYYDRSDNPQSINGGHNEYYYPLASETVKSYAQTWWYQGYSNLGLKLGINNSIHNSSVIGYTADAGCSTYRLNSLDDNGIPNIVIVHFGDEDNRQGTAVEDMKKAYIIIIEYITKNFVTFENNTAKIPYIYISTNGYSLYQGYKFTEKRRNEYNNMFKELANQYDNVRIFDIDSIITKDNFKEYLDNRSLLNDLGMNAVGLGFIEQLKKDFKTNK